MTVAFVELKKLLVAAQHYLDGDCSIQELHGRAAELSTVSQFFSSHPSIPELAQDWISVIDRRWNECNLISSPLSEADFRKWLEAQLLKHSTAEA